MCQNMTVIQEDDHDNAPQKRSIVNAAFKMAMLQAADGRMDNKGNQPEAN